MNNRIFALLLPLFSVLSFDAFSQTYWKYPIVPGTKEWTSLKTMREIIAVQQIPDDTLRRMSTEAVLHAWLDLPGRIEMLAFNTLQAGFDVTRKRYNVLNELVKREDVGQIVLEKFSTLSPSDLAASWDSKKKGRFITEYAFMELLLSQPEVLESLTNPQRKAVFDKARQDLAKKAALPIGDHDFFWASSGLVLGCRILEREGVQLPEAVQSRNGEADLLRRGEIISREEFQQARRTVSESDF